MPRSMMRPCSMTMMQSALRTVDSRWAMTKVVRPVIKASMPSCTSRSVRVSMEEVAYLRGDRSQTLRRFLAILEQTVTVAPDPGI